MITLTDRGGSVATALQAEEQAFARMLFDDLPTAELSNFVATLDHVLGWLRGSGSASPDEP